MKYILLYLGAIVIANITISALGPAIGPWASIVTAFLFIGLDLTSRDKLHELWHGNKFALKMGLLVLTGSALSFFLYRNSRDIAIASFLAFASANIVDTLVYQKLLNKPKFLKINSSNMASALVDSVVFPTIAFGGIMPIITIGQFLAKLLGGLLWGLWLFREDK